MRTALFSLLRFRYLIFGFVFLFFLALAPLNQSKAVGLGQACIVAAHTPGINCDSGLSCDTSADSTSMCTQSGTCHGVCRATCIEYQGGPANGGCAADEVCQEDPGCTSYGCSGKCISAANVRVKTGSYCTYKSPSDTTGNCITGDICQHDSGIANLGICFPANYSCNPAHDSRGINAVDTNQYNADQSQSLGFTNGCPGTLACVEDHGLTYTPPKGTSVVGVVTGGLVGGVGNIGGAVTNAFLTYSCHPKQEVAVSCTCDATAGSVASGQNGFNCQNKLAKDHTFCQAGAACSNSPGAFIDGPELQRVFGTAPKTGVVCSNVEPAPPAPPCVTWTDGKCTAIKSAFGTLQTDPAGFISKLFGILLAAGGAIALLLFLRAGYRIMTSRGNPEGIKEGREQIVAAIIGLMFIIFSFVILQVIGVDLLKLPGSSTTSGGSAEAPPPVQ